MAFALNLHITGRHFACGRLLHIQNTNTSMPMPMETEYPNINSCSDIDTLCRQNRLKEAFALLQKFISVDSNSYASLFAACGNLKALREAKLVQGHMILSGIELDVYTGSKLLSAYAKCGSLSDARVAFENIPTKNLFTWNAMIIAYSCHGSSQDVLECFRHMLRQRIQPDIYTFPCILKACAALEALDYGREIHNFVVTNEFQSDVFVDNALMAMYAKCGRIEDARKVFDKMPLRDVVSWNSVIAGYAQNGNFDETLQLFRQMLFLGVKPNSVTVASVLPACSYLGDLQQGMEIHSYINRSGIQTDALMWNALVTLYAKCGCLDEARRLFDTMPERDVVSWNAMIAGYAQNGRFEESLQLFHQMEISGEEPNVSTWNGMIAGCAQRGQYSEALRILKEMQLRNEKPNSVTITSILPACAHIADLEHGKEIHSYITKIDLESSVFVGTALIDMYAKCGSIESARRVFDKICQDSVVLWTAIISGYAMHGRGRDTLSLFYQMQNAGIKPDYITFTAVLSACSHAGLEDEGWQCFNSMSRDYCLTPSVKHYACMVDLLGRAGRLIEAYAFIRSMPVEPDASVWGALLSASRIHHNVQLGERAAEQLFDLEPENTGNFVLLANIYAEAGQWDNVRIVRKLMKDRGLMKNPGCSWIAVKNRVHAFLIGDRSHPEMEQIYAQLESVAQQMKEEGYVPSTICGLHGEGEEDYVLCGHVGV